jgi:hypothetical protein
LLRQIAKNERHVVPSPAGGWDIKKPNADRSSGHFDKQQQADKRADQILRDIGGGENVTHGRDGQIREKDTVAPARDPRSSKG